MIKFMPLFVVAAVFAVVFMILRAKRPENKAYQAAVGVALAAAFFLFWVNGAVGIIGSSDNDANMMYAGVLAVGFIGAVIGRFEPIAMARALSATAVAQIVAAVIALAAGSGTDGAIWPWDIVVGTVFFAALWAVSAWLFRISVRKEPPAGGGDGR